MATFINACVDEARFYAEQGEDSRARNVLYLAVDQITWNYTRQNSLNSLGRYGVKEITTFADTAIFDDLRIVASEARRPLSWVLQAWTSSSNPRLPERLSPFRLMLRSIARPGMFFVDREELDRLMKAIEVLADQLTYSDVWKEVIQAHASEEYDLALFYSFV